MGTWIYNPDTKHTDDVAKRLVERISAKLKELGFKYNVTYSIAPVAFAGAIIGNEVAPVFSVDYKVDGDTYGIKRIGDRISEIGSKLYERGKVEPDILSDDGGAIGDIVNFLVLVILKVGQGVLSLLGEAGCQIALTFLPIGCVLGVIYAMTGEKKGLKFSRNCLLGYLFLEALVCSISIYR